MISKAIRGRGFNGAISYICSKADAIRTVNIASENWRVAGREMRAVASLNSTQKCVYHHWLSFSPDEPVTNEKMFEAATRMLEKLGIEQHQSVMAVHRDREHSHIHIVTNLIGFDGRAAKLSHDFRSRPVFAREIESEMDLKRFEKSKERSTNRMADERIAEIKNALSSSRSEADLKSNLAKIGIRIEEKSSRANSINFRIFDLTSGAHIPGSKVDAVLSSPSSLKRHLSQPRTTAESVVKSTWNTARNVAVERAAAASKTWDELRRNLQSQNLNFEIITRENGNRGLVFTDPAGGRIAGSKIDNALSFGRLSKRFDQPQPQTVEAQNDKAEKRVPPSTSTEKSPWEQYSIERDDHFRRIGRKPEDLKAEAARIKADRERLWRDYNARTSLIPQCFSPQYRRTMREIEQENFHRAKRRLDLRAEAIRASRFPSFTNWKDGAAAPVIQPKQSLQSLWQKVRDFFQPIAGSAEHYHRSHTYQPKPPPLTAPPQLRPVAATTSGSSDANFYALMNSPSILRASAALETALRRHSPAPARSNEHARRNNDHQR